VIYNGLDLDRFSVESISKRQSARDSGAVKTVGIVANLRKVKGLEVFIEAAKKLSDLFFDLRFAVVGEGPERGFLEKLAADLGIGHRVHFLGSRRDIPEILASFDIGVLCSHYESFSNSILEYMAAGLPVVCTDVGGAREVITDGVNGFLVPPDDPVALADSIRNIIEQDLFLQFGRANRARVEEGFSPSSMIERFESIYSDLIGKKSCSTS
jgi:glycosyltransferase involved in cell wall biosynthesis